MLGRSNISAVLPVRDLESSKKFYQEKLGLKGWDTTPTGEYRLCCEGGAEIQLRPLENAYATGLTEVSFRVKDIEKEIEELESKGVKFEDYQNPPYKTGEHHIHEEGNMKAAWFKDPTGNVLCIHQYLA